MARLSQRTEQGDVAHELLFRSNSIGRGSLNDVVIVDPGERRVHAEIVALGPGRFLVRDSRSRGGVRVNGERVEGQRELAHGDLLGVGPATFVFDATPDEAAAPAADRGASLGGGVVKLTVGTFVSRVFGYVREMVAMAYFGLSGALDAYVAASTLANLFRDVLGEYAAENAFMPTYKTLLARGRAAEARRLLASVFHVVMLVGLAIVLLGLVFAPWMVAGLVPGFARDHPDLLVTATALARWMMPFLLIVAVASLFGSLLLADRRFTRYSLAPVGSSVCAIAAVVLLSGKLGVGSLAVGVVAGGVVQMVICAAPYVQLRRRREPEAAPRAERGGPALRKVARSAIPITLAGLLNKVNGVVDRILASWFCGLGRISALYGAFLLLQLPFGILGLAVGRAAFPSLIEQASTQEGDGFSRAVVRALRLSVFLMLPASVGLMLLARPFVRLMFERRQFTAEHTGWAALALACYAAGLVAMGARTVLARAFYALLNTRTPFLLSAVDVGLNVVLSVALVMTPLEHGGLALASSAATWVQTVLLLLMLGRELQRQGRRLRLDGLWANLGRLAVAGAAMAACTWACDSFLGALWAGGGALARVAALGVPGAAGLVAYLGTALLLGCDEARALRPRRARLPVVESCREPNP